MKGTWPTWASPSAPQTISSGSPPSTRCFRGTATPQWPTTTVCCTAICWCVCACACVCSCCWDCTASGAQQHPYDQRQPSAVLPSAGASVPVPVCVAAFRSALLSKHSKNPVKTNEEYLLFCHLLHCHRIHAVPPFSSVLALWMLFNSIALHKQMLCRS